MPTEMSPLLRQTASRRRPRGSPDEFRGVFSQETVTRYVEDSYARRSGTGRRSARTSCR